MSLIAGYVTKNGKIETSRITDTVKYYSILPRKDQDCYENIVIETKHGHIVQKYKKD